MRSPRSPARTWIEVLKIVMPVLSESDANDTILFGSQAMSIYTERALASKDVDLIVPGMTISILEELCVELAKVADEKPVYDFTKGEYSGRSYPVSHIYVKHRAGYPLVVEFFQTFLGFDSRRLTPFIAFRDKWGMRVQVLVPEAIIGTRLAFRPPERITPSNAERLSRFIRTLGKGIDWSEVNTFIDAFGLRSTVQENLKLLRSRHISVPGSSKILS